MRSGAEKVAAALAAGVDNTESAVSGFGTDKSVCFTRIGGQKTSLELFPGKRPRLVEHLI
jgi:hypothetical protein